MDIVVKYTAEFIRSYYKLEQSLQQEAKEKIALFKKRAHHKTLKVHKLHGRMKDRYGFSINYKYRIVFEYESKNVAILKSIGDHDIYK
jgi:mRNA-degrading endonuclease YafQ of YafQ-DinJ toxin-antitoxin module